MIIQCSIFLTHFVITQIWIEHSHVVAPIFFHGNLQRIFRKITQIWIEHSPVVAPNLFLSWNFTKEL